MTLCGLRFRREGAGADRGGIPIPPWSLELPLCPASSIYHRARIDTTLSRAAADGMTRLAHAAMANFFSRHRLDRWYVPNTPLRV